MAAGEAPNERVIDALVEAVGLKRVARAGWVRVGVRDAESVAAHSWGVAWLVLALLPDDLDRGRALAYAVVHDLAEVRVGDLMPSDRVADKADRERRAFAAIVSPLGRDLAGMFGAYEHQADAESRFVRQCDRLDMALQALAYAAESGADLTEFVDSAARVIEHPALVAILGAVRARLATEPTNSCPGERP